MTPRASADARYFAGNEPVRLGPRIGRGGEGEVFALEDDPAWAAKLYSADLAPRREPKITAMVSAGLAEAGHAVAFPRAVLREGERFAGFLMPRILAAEPVHELYAPGSRKERFAGADYRFLVRAALNTARAVAAVHAVDCVIGDVNHSGILVADDARVVLIDADSFEFEWEGVRFPCEVGVPEYTPPELAGRSLAGVRRTPDHDAFGLAVILFQLLFMGRHPFAGVSAGSEVMVPEAIATHRFAYSRERATGLSPPPGAARLEDLPPAVAALFERAFGPADGGARPSAAAWVNVLERFEEDLRPCLDSLRHYHSAREALSCPWCRVERETGAELFLLPPSLAEKLDPGFVLPPFDATAARAHLASVEPPVRFLYEPPAPVAPRPPPARRSPWAALLKVGAGLVMIALAVTQAILIPTNWLLSMPAAAAGVVWVLAWFKPDRAAQQDLVHLDSRLSRALLNVQDGVDLDTPVLLKAEIEALVDAREALARHGSATVREAQEAQIVRARLRYLEALPPPEDLTGTGILDGEPDRSAAIPNAAEVLRQDLDDLDPVRKAALLAWARGAVAAFDPTSVSRSSPAEVSSEQEERLRREAAELDTRIDRAMRRLEASVAALRDAATARDPRIDALLAHREVLVAEVEGVGGTPPTFPSPPAIHVRQETLRRAREMRSAITAASGHHRV